MIQISIDDPEKSALRLLCQRTKPRPMKLVEFLISDAFNRTNRAKVKLI